MVTRRTPWPAGTPCWVDLAADVERAAAFYGALLGWEVHVGGPETGGYALCRKDGKAVAGLGPRTDDEFPVQWTTYLATEDVDTTAARVAEAGGRVLFSPVDVMDKGRMTLAVDPLGATFGLWQAGTNTGMELANEPGSVTWNDQASQDPAKSMDFYAHAFGYHYQPVPGAGEYRTIHLAEDTDAVGGIGEVGAPAWHTYFQVEDTDAAIETLLSLGGSVVAPAEDTAFGRFATVTDDQGAEFKIISPQDPDED